MGDISSICLSGESFLSNPLNESIILKALPNIPDTVFYRATTFNPNILGITNALKNFTNLNFIKSQKET